ncbi:26S proteasome regulatory subunit N7 [Enteropsectra breve]|nr:26S proteasome regulatory subunit N7 [Enteropsectra breve]
MDINFIEPKLELKFMIRKAVKTGQTECLKVHLINSCNETIFRRLAEAGLLEHDSKAVETMREAKEKKIQALESKKEADLENDSHVVEVETELAEFYASCMEMEKFSESTQGLMEKEPSLSLKMDIFLCEIRMALILDDRATLIRKIEMARDVFESTCDWDRKNRFRVYLGLFNLVRADFEGAAVLFSESLTSFNAEELLSFETVILYLVFSGLLSFSRTKINELILSNSEVNKCTSFMKLPKCLYNCEYQEYFSAILEFLEQCADDLFLEPFRENFCREMKIKGYRQLIMSYQTLHLDRMAEIFSISREHLEEDLRNFINENKLRCVIDRVDGAVHIVDKAADDSISKRLKDGSLVLRNIIKRIH